MLCSVICPISQLRASRAYKGDVDKNLTGYIAWADGEVSKLHGVPLPPHDSNVALIADNAALSTLPLSPIVAEMKRLEALFSADKLVQEQYTALTSRIAQENSALQTLETRLTNTQGPIGRFVSRFTLRENI